jgi:hypothetical protein
VAKDAPDADTDTSVIGRITIGFFEKGSRHKKAKPALLWENTRGEKGP